MRTSLSCAAWRSTDVSERATVVARSRAGLLCNASFYSLTSCVGLFEAVQLKYWHIFKHNKWSTVDLKDR